MRAKGVNFNSILTTILRGVNMNILVGVTAGNGNQKGSSKHIFQVNKFYSLSFSDLSDLSSVRGTSKPLKLNSN